MEHHESIPLLKHYIPLSNASSERSRLRSRLPLATGTRALPARDTIRQVTIARRRLICLLVSASVGMSTPPEQTKAASAGRVKIAQIYHCPELGQMQFKNYHKLPAKSLGGLCAALGASSKDVTRPTPNSISDPSRTLTTASPGQAAGCPDEWHSIT